MSAHPILSGPAREAGAFARAGAAVRGVVRAVPLLGWLAIAVALVLAIVAVVTMPQSASRPLAPGNPARSRPATDAAATMVPEAMPLELVKLTPDDARAANAALPMVAGPIPAAPPFRFAGSAQDLLAATDCLTIALLYEAGDDAPGQQAVAQVILNRLRHPAFPKSVCGVVFQGSERPTGCQFTFTCDGAMVRTPNPAALARARTIATAALAGTVAANVGLATHYHTDWVYPYWAPTLDKIARVHTHLFYRWKGWWGTRGAFLRSYLGSERLTPRLAQIMGREIDGAVPIVGVTPADLVTDDSTRVLSGTTVADPAPAATPLKGASIALADADRGVFVLKLDPAAFAGDYAMSALALCSKRADCTVVGYLRPAETPTALPLAPQDVRRAALYYHATAGSSQDTTYWNCHQIPRKDLAQCLPGTR